MTLDDRLGDSANNESTAAKLNAIRATWEHKLAKTIECTEKRTRLEVFFQPIAYNYNITGIALWQTASLYAEVLGRDMGLVHANNGTEASMADYFAIKDNGVFLFRTPQVFEFLIVKNKGLLAYGCGYERASAKNMTVFCHPEAAGFAVEQIDRFSRARRFTFNWKVTSQFSLEGVNAPGSVILNYAKTLPVYSGSQKAF
jgi:hypothetical protein